MNGYHAGLRSRGWSFGDLCWRQSFFWYFKIISIFSIPAKSAACASTLHSFAGLRGRIHDLANCSSCSASLLSPRPSCTVFLCLGRRLCFLWPVSWIAPYRTGRILLSVNYHNTCASFVSHPLICGSICFFAPSAPRFDTHWASESTPTSIHLFERSHSSYCQNCWSD